ncbi:MAG TPA: LPS assembly protein LptD, partial [Rhodocyclaceae bacterium]
MNYPFRLTTSAALVLLLIVQPTVAVDELVPRLRLSPAPIGLRAPRDAVLPVFFSAQRVVGDMNSVVANGDVEMRQLGLRIGAERITYNAIEDTLEASGAVELDTTLARLRGNRLLYRPGQRSGRLEELDYEILPPQQSFPPGRLSQGAHGEAAAVVIDSENQYQLEDATFSTCRPGDDSWFLRVSDLRLDYDSETGDGYHAAVWFKGVPIFYSPWITFPLNNKRRTGFLPPTIGSTSVSGFELTVPYYLNLAPNMDATLTPRYFSKRGSQLNSEYRYLGQSFSGETRLEYLPDDQLREIDRWGYSVQHRQRLPLGLYASANVNGVSDDNYYRDLSSRASTSA